ALMAARAKGRKTGGGSPAGEAAKLPDLTAPVEDYLKAIYELERAGEPAATTDLAAHLGLTPASVTGMVRRLAGHGLLTHERYRGVRLTQKGKRSALRTIRRHRVIEAYLVQALGYAWDEVHPEAERLEHAATDALVDRMALAIGEPTVDPHGAPIPSREGAADEAPMLLRYLADLALTPGCTVRVVERAPYGGPITIEVNRRRKLIGPALA